MSGVAKTKNIFHDDTVTLFVAKYCSLPYLLLMVCFDVFQTMRGHVHGVESDLLFTQMEVMPFLKSVFTIGQEPTHAKVSYCP